MDITHAYIREHGECPEWDNSEIDYWRCNKVYFTSGWNAVDKIEIAKQLYLEWDKWKEKEARNSLTPYPMFFLEWLDKLGVQEELLEIEADVLYQQEGLVEGR